MDSSRLVRLLGTWDDGDGPLYRQLAASIGTLIDTGSLRGGDRLPAERLLAEELSVSRGTVVKAFDRLAEDGMVERVQGSGTTVSGNRLPAVPGEFLSDPLWKVDAGRSISLLQAHPTLLPEVARAVEHVDLDGLGPDLDSSEPLGWWRLRRQIADLHTRQDLPTGPHEVMVLNGAQQGMSLVVRAFVGAGDVVVGEEHTWPGLVDAVRQAGARYEPVRMDDQGVDVGDLERQVVRYRPVAMVLNPQNHNPTGTRLPLDRVREVARLAREHDALVIEDRVSADLGFDRRRLPVIADHDTGGRAITLMSLCKAAWPGLRLGWLRAEPQIVNQLRAHKAVADMFSSLLSQAAAVRLLDRYDELIEARSSQLRDRCEVVVESLRRDLPEWTFTRPRGGLSVWAALPAGVSADSFVQQAAMYGVQLASCRQFSATEMDSGHVRIPYTAPEPVLAEGMRRIAAAWATFDRTPGATPLVAM